MIKHPRFTNIILIFCAGGSSAYLGSVLSHTHAFESLLLKIPLFSSPEYLEIVKRAFNLYLVFISVLICCIFLFNITFKKLVNFIKKFLLKTASPFNLAIFRIVLFADIIFSIKNPESTGNIFLLSGLPGELTTSLPGLQLITSTIPCNESFFKFIFYIFLFFCWAGLFGFFSRTSCFIVSVLGFYILGISQAFGKINHYHHLLWFSSLLAFSKCGDFLSIDKIIQSIKKKSRGKAYEIHESHLYFSPIGFVWILLGLIYFFPGFWKISSISQWVLGDDLRGILHLRWFQKEWVPFFRLDQHPFIYRSVALGVILFEVSFIFLIFSKRIRPFLLLAGIIFHFFTNMFMKISFFNLQIIYAALLDWESIFKSISKNIFKNFSGSSQVLYKRNKDTQNKKIDILRTDNFIFIWGWLLIAINSFFGFLAIEKSWPFACYPTFVNIYHPTRWVLRLEGEDANGKNIILDKTISEKISVNRYNSILNKIYESKTSKERTNLLQVFILDLKSKSIIPEKIFGVRLYRDLVKLSPEDWGKNPIERTLIEYIKII